MRLPRSWPPDRGTDKVCEHCSSRAWAGARLPGLSELGDYPRPPQLRHPGFCRASGHVLFVELGNRHLPGGDDDVDDEKEEAKDNEEHDDDGHHHHHHHHHHHGYDDDHDAVSSRFGVEGFGSPQNARLHTLS